jgi:asparagine synthase (glutamine-hydrolysing)
MSGIFGIINKDMHARTDTTVLEKAINSIVHQKTGKVFTRKHQNIGTAAYDQFGDGSERFIYEDNRLLVVCDAEIYNYNDFKNSKLPLNSFGEAQIIADLFLKKGNLWWQDVQGVYSAFIWDKKENEGFIFTDRIGVKPIVYFEDREKIIIASRIKSIVNTPGFVKKLNKQALFSYTLMEMIPTPYAIYENVRKLESGHMMRVHNGSISIEMVWKQEYHPEKLTNLAEMKEQIYALTKNAVSLQLDYRAQVGDVGCFLSGGTDSSTLVGLVNEIYPGEARTFSIGFDEPGFDEMEYARIAAKAFNTKHTEYYVSQNDIVDILPKIVEDYDEPFGNSSVIPTYFCAKIARENGIKILLGGDGGDEIFGGNARYHDNFVNFSRYPQWLSKFLWLFMRNLPPWITISIIKKVYNYLKRSNSPLYERIHAYNLYHYFDSQEIFQQDFLKEQTFHWPADISKYYIEQAGTSDFLDQYLYNDLKLTLMDNDLRKVNQMTEFANIHPRYPFLDHMLVNFTGFLPSSVKVNDGRLRYIFKETFKELLPQEIINKTKHGFGLPVVPWMLRPGKLNTLLEEYLFDSGVIQQEIFNSKFIEKIYKQAKTDNTHFYGTYLYFLLFLEMWLAKHFINQS